MKDQENLPLGIVLERRRVAHPWKDFDWRPVTVIPGAADLDPEGAWRVLAEGDDWIRLFVVLRSGEDADCDHDVVPFLVTACPYEAQDYMDSGEELVEPVIMPPGVTAFVQAYIDRHHVDEPFKKRKRKRHDTEDAGFSRPAPVDRRRNGRG